MKVFPSRLEGVLLIEPHVVEDNRGTFVETFNAARYAEIGITQPFVQTNRSYSRRDVLRGLHYQVVPNEQGKLVTCTRGVIYDVVVDLRKGSPTYFEHVGFILKQNYCSCLQLWIPPGFAHGFLALTDAVEIIYQTTALYAPESGRSIAWNDPTLAIEWPLEGRMPLLSPKDAAAPFLLSR